MVREETEIPSSGDWVRDILNLVAQDVLTGDGVEVVTPELLAHVRQIAEQGLGDEWLNGTCPNAEVCRDNVLLDVCKLIRP